MILNVIIAIPISFIDYCFWLLILGKQTLQRAVTLPVPRIIVMLYKACYMVGLEHISFRRRRKGSVAIPACLDAVESTPLRVNWKHSS